MQIELIGHKKNKKNKRDNLPGIDRVAGLLVSMVVLSFFFLVSSPIPSRDFSQSATVDAFDSLIPIWNDADFSSSRGSPADGLVYPYSVIPGGVTSAKRLQTALSRDPIAAAHYSGFATHSAHVVRLTRDRQVYVSYRLANHIYWTRKKVTLHAGEALLSDGAHLARTRCGNRVSETPAGPTAPSEPAREVLERPVVARPVEDPGDALPPAPIWTEPPTPVLVALGNIAQPYSPGGNGPTPSYPVPICCATSPRTASTPTPPYNPLPQPYPVPPAPPTATSEPRSLVLLIAGLAGFLLLWIFRQP